jgi:trigger factor
LAKKVTSGKIKTLEDLKKDIEKYFGGVEEKENQKRMEDAIFSKIMDDAKIDIQRTMIQREVEAIKGETQRRAQMQGLSWDDLVKREGADKIEKQLEEEAVKRIKNTLIMEKIADKEKISIEQKDIIDEINEMAMTQGDRGKALMEEINQNPSSLQVVAQQVITKKVTSLLLSNNTFKVKTKKGKK